MWFKVRHRGTAKGGTHPRDHRPGGAQARGFDHGPLPMDPVRFKQIQPGTVARQPPGHEAYSPVSRALLLLRQDPGTDRWADVPGGMVPPQHQDPLPLGGQRLAEPGETGRRDVAHGSAVDNASPDLGGAVRRRSSPAKAVGAGACRRSRGGGPAAPADFPRSHRPSRIPRRPAGRSGAVAGRGAFFARRWGSGAGAPARGPPPVHAEPVARLAHGRATDRVRGQAALPPALRRPA